VGSKTQSQLYSPVLVFSKINGVAGAGASQTPFNAMP